MKIQGLPKIFSDVEVDPSATEATLTFDAVATSGTLTLEVNGVETAAIDFDATVAEIKAAIVAVLDDTSLVVTGTIADQSIVVSARRGRCEIAEGTNALLATATPVVLTIAHVREWILDLEAVAHLAIEVAYGANAGSDMTVGFGLSRDKCQVDANLTQAQNPAGGFYVWLLENVFSRYMQLTLPDDSAPTVKVQAIRFGVL